MQTVPDDRLWQTIREEAATDAANEPTLAGFLNTVILGQSSLEASLGYILASKLGSQTVSALTLRDMIADVFENDAGVQDAIRADLQAVATRDPACRGYTSPLLYFKGFHSLQAYRVAHEYWVRGRKPLALYLQSRISEVFAVDIHPGAVIGKGILFDHATSVVIGETAVVGDDFSMLHEVTLGGSGKEAGDRHPKIGRGVMIGAGAKILGNIRVGEGAKVGAGSVVLHEVPPHTTVAGIPAKPVSVPKVELPALTMDQLFCNGDPIADAEPSRPIIGTLAYLVRDGKVLMVHRSKQWTDHHLGKYNGLGGKLESDEDVVACLRRELREEAGVELTSFKLKGTISWPGFGTDGEDWFGFVFLVDGFEGEPPQSNHEGTLHWVPLDELNDLPMWEGDYTWLPLVFDDSVAQFHGVMPYRDGRPQGWSVTKL